MTPHPTEQEDWDPREPAVLKDQIAAYDAMRRRCPVAHSEYLHWSVFAHRDVLRIVQDAQAFSNVVSAHVSIPNGMDPPAHTAWRALIEPYFAQPVLDAFAPRAAAIARDRMLALPASGDGDVDVEWMGAFSEPCAVRLLCAYMGWSDELHEPLRQWARRNQAATLAGDREATAAMAFEFDGHIGAQLAARRAAGGPAQDLTARLLGETVDGRPLRDDEIVSIIRNWTVGELSTLAASIGILTEYLARHPGLQQRLRQEPQLLAPAIDEILRIHPPLIANRRVARQAVQLQGRDIAAGDRLSVIWASANRDETVFDAPDEFRLDRDPAQNLLYGAGVHVCPGAGLSRLQLRIVMEHVLAMTRDIALAPHAQAERACYPASGFVVLPLQVRR